jgi:serine/threonine-protein kinase
MEMLSGVDLENLVERFAPVLVGRAVRLLRQACRSLLEAHESGLIHRDIKPANIST